MFSAVLPAGCFFLLLISAAGQTSISHLKAYLVLNGCLKTQYVFVKRKTPSRVLWNPGRVPLVQAACNALKNISKVSYKLWALSFRVQLGFSACKCPECCGIAPEMWHWDGLHEALLNSGLASGEWCAARRGSTVPQSNKCSLLNVSCTLAGWKSSLGSQWTFHGRRRKTHRPRKIQKVGVKQHTDIIITFCSYEGVFREEKNRKRNLKGLLFFSQIWKSLHTYSVLPGTSLPALGHDWEGCSVLPYYSETTARVLWLLPRGMGTQCCHFVTVLSLQGNISRGFLL